MPHSSKAVVLLILAAGASPWHGLADDAIAPEDAAAMRAEAPEDAPEAAPEPPPNPSASRASAVLPGEELAVVPYVYPLLRMRVTPEMR